MKHRVDCKSRVSLLVYCYESYLTLMSVDYKIEYRANRINTLTLVNGREAIQFPENTYFPSTTPK